MKDAIFLVKTLLTIGRENQAFIGAEWIVGLLRVTPGRFKRRLALIVLGASPHYFYRNMRDDYKNVSHAEFLEGEAERNRDSREKIASLILAPCLHPQFTVLDYGCGPGFLAKAVSSRVAKVFAVDVSQGVLECARIVNGGDSITYLHTSELSQIPDHSVDLCYSFAVIQHVTDGVFHGILDGLNRILKPGGMIVFHVVVDGEGWRSESDWVADKSIKGQVKLKYGLNCFSRDRDSLLRILEAHGFSSILLQPVSAICSENFDDICSQHLVTAVLREPGKASATA